MPAYNGPPIDLCETQLDGSHHEPSSEEPELENDKLLTNRDDREAKNGELSRENSSPLDLDQELLEESSTDGQQVVGADVNEIGVFGQQQQTLNLTVAETSKILGITYPSTMTSGMEFGRSPDRHSELSAQFGPSSHPLGMLGSLTALQNMQNNVQSLSAVAGLSGLPAGSHGDVLEKLKMQVRDMKVDLGGMGSVGVGSSGGGVIGSSDQSDFAALHASFRASALQHHQQMQQGAGGAVGSLFGNSDLNRALVGGPGGLVGIGGGTGSGIGANSNGDGDYPFSLPNPPINKDGHPGSNSSTSSETSNSSAHQNGNNNNNGNGGSNLNNANHNNNNNNNGWSFEEQFKQVRQLYEINDDPKRKEFLDELFLFMQKRGTPINRLPIMAKSVLDLYELYNLVIARGGLVDVINKKLWQEIIKGLHLPSSITSAAFTLRTQYMKYLYPYECEKKNFSSPAELQAAIDGNRREGRRTGYGQFDSPSVQRSPIPQGIQQMSPLSLVTHVNQQQHHRLLGAPNVGQIPNMLPAEFEQRMLDYIKLFQPKEMKREQSPEQQITPRDALNALEMSRVALWNMYNNNTSPPNSLNTSPPEMQREALNLAESPPHHQSIKREREYPMDFTDRSAMGRDFHHSGLPPAKRSNSIAAVAAAQLQAAQQQQQQLHHPGMLHPRSLTPQKLNLSSHEDDDDVRSDGTPINLRGENGLSRHHRDEDMHDDEEEEDEDEDMNMTGDDLQPPPHHPLALNPSSETEESFGDEFKLIDVPSESKSSSLQNPQMSKLVLAESESKDGFNGDAAYRDRLAYQITRRLTNDGNLFCLI
ncbi:protein dead ringer [Uranotaenia lowii]|uniref:protein dead ringer n=1 Tax=Uranotaenia lowii TaxID=190385 RepID=UPI00247A942A|nr:protein dead ringer [Uranotaenia lowii]